MKWEIVENFTEGKISNDLNEDRLVITPDIIAVIDGVTGSEPINGRPGGIVAAETIAEAVRTFDATKTATEFVQDITRRFRELQGINLHATRRAAAGFTLFNMLRNEIWGVGDCPCSVDGKTLFSSGPDKLDAISGGFRAALARAWLGLGTVTADEIRQNDPSREVVWNLLSVQSFFANNPNDPLGYGVIDGEDVPPKFIQVVKLENPSEIIITSDGFITPASTLVDAEKELADVLVKDPLCILDNIHTKCLKDGQKSFDDRTYVRLRRS